MSVVQSLDQRNLVNRLPRCSYRLQLRRQFGFKDVLQILPYLKELGISDLYLSPLFSAREDSEHGYDVVDHTRIEPAFGDRSAFLELAAKARESGMGVLLDIVPNHMGINDQANIQWYDVLENGQNARSAVYFDIDWEPSHGGVPRKVLLPCLGRPFGEALENAELQIEFDESGFFLRYFERKFPLASNSWVSILDLAVDYLSQTIDEPSREELLSIATHFRRLTSDGENMTEYYREQRVARSRLAVLRSQSDDVELAIAKAVSQINGQPGSPKSFDTLERILAMQHYRLAFWQVAYDEINYRRFFDINDLAAIRVEDPSVFEHVHQVTFDLLKEGAITGLRIDHPDGLLDPTDYFRQLQSTFRACVSTDQELYIVAEKILSGEEQLLPHWKISGTTGYEFLNHLSAVLVAPHGVRELKQNYVRTFGSTARDTIYHGKRTILRDSMSSEASVLASRLFRLARSDRSTYDFTLPVLTSVLKEWIACFSVYRTYTRPTGWDVSVEDQGRIKEAIRIAKLRNNALPWSAFDYLAKVLLLEFPAQLSDAAKREWRQLAVRLQQVTGPVTAKGIEDTSFYRYYPLASLNEVGAELDSEGCTLEEFHRRMHRRASEWPRALSTTATHDTKRGEDVRARLHVLSEMPEQYLMELQRWESSVERFISRSDDEEVPSRNERYLIHQTMIGTLPIGLKIGSSDASNENSPLAQFESRMQQYFQKAFREAKQHTSWRSPMEKHESKVREFIHNVLFDEESFQLLDGLAKHIAAPGYVNSITQMILKATLPGVPDFYQGTEYWDFHLVDPDNRRPVDYAERSTSLQSLSDRFATDAGKLLQELGTNWDRDLKLLMTQRVLHFRNEYWPVFASGTYTPLEVRGSQAQNVIAFYREFENSSVAIIVPRWPYTLISDHDPSSAVLRDFCGEVWKDTTVQMPPAFENQTRELLLDKSYSLEDNSLKLSDSMSELCFCILTN